MKDEEMAEEFANEKCKDCYMCSYSEHKNPYKICQRRKDRKQAFLAGLKAGRPQWHDLRKDPNDLPKHNNYVLGYCRGDYYDVCFFNGKRLIGHGESDFLKWKEIE
jgi:hypothetical protein